jgi:hypothetical protein
MLYVLLALGALLGFYLLLVQTLFKGSKCHGKLPMAGKTVIITGIENRTTLDY